MTKILSAASAILLIFGAAQAAPQPQNEPAPPERDPYGYYSQMDQEGYYDRDGRYVRYDDRNYDQASEPQGDYGRPPPQVYSRGDYEARCRRGNQAAGTLFGAIAGGLIGGAASSGRHHGADPGAVVGGIILGGLLGNAVSRDIPCEDHGYAFRTYADGLNGRLGTRYDWRNEDSGDYGYFVPEHEFRRGGALCRSFRETTYIGGKRYDRTGTACRRGDGHWHFE